MVGQEEIRRGRHVVSKLHCHLVFVTKYRRNAITARVFEALMESWRRTADRNGVRLVEANHEGDHVHLHVEYPPDLAVSRLVGALKGASSYAVRGKRFKEVEDVLWGRHFWSPSYFAASCGGASLEVLKHYIQQQRGALPPPSEEGGFRAQSNR